MTCVVCSLHPIWPQAQRCFAQQLDAADFATEEPPQEEDEDYAEEEEADHSANANDSVCIQCDDGGMLMVVHGAAQAQHLRFLLCTCCSANACASSCCPRCFLAVTGARCPQLTAACSLLQKLIPGGHTAQAAASNCLLKATLHRLHVHVSAGLRPVASDAFPRMQASSYSVMAPACAPSILASTHSMMKKSPTLGTAIP